MILGIGIDIIEVARISKSIQRKGFKEKIFSKLEIDYCEKKANMAERFAARFAAKEAFLKALGTGLRSGMAFNEIEVVNDEQGKPSIRTLGVTSQTIKEMGIKTIHLSLSHTKKMAVASVVIELC